MRRLLPPPCLYHHLLLQPRFLLSFLRWRGVSFYNRMSLFLSLSIPPHSQLSSAYRRSLAPFLRSLPQVGGASRKEKKPLQNSASDYFTCNVYRSRNAGDIPGMHEKITSWVAKSTLCLRDICYVESTTVQFVLLFVCTMSLPYI